MRNWSGETEKAPLKRGLRPKGGGGFFPGKNMWPEKPTSRLQPARCSPTAHRAHRDAPLRIFSWLSCRGGLWPPADAALRPRPWKTDCPVASRLAMTGPPGRAALSVHNSAR